MPEETAPADPTAMAVVEVAWRGGAPTREGYQVTSIWSDCPGHAVSHGRRAPGRRVKARCPKILTVYAGAAGVGQPVVDILKAAGVPVKAVYYTHGDRRIQQDDGTITLGKAWLASRLQALLQTGRILLPSTPQARALARELQDYEIKVSEDANDRYGAFKVGAHDDLVTALCLAVQKEVMPPPTVSPIGIPRASVWGPIERPRRNFGENRG